MKATNYNRSKTIEVKLGETISERIEIGEDKNLIN